MFYENNLECKSIKYKTINILKFNDFDSYNDKSIMGLSSSPLTYNFDSSSGALKDGIGVRKLRFKSYPDDVTFKDLDNWPTVYHPTACWLSNIFTTDFNVFRSLLVVQDSNGDIYYNLLHNDSTDFIKVDGLNFDTEPIVMTCKINNEDHVVFVAKNEGVYTWKYPYTVKKIDNVPPLRSVCVHNNRLYAITYNDKRSVIFSDDIDITNFNLDMISGSRIDMNDSFGACNKVVSFKGYLYIFRDFNIAKLIDYANRVDFEVSQLYVSNGRIFDKTVCVCGDNIIYLASDGIYSFNGTTSKRLNFKLDKLFEGVDNYNAVAGYSNGYYYLSCKLNYGDGNAVVDGEWSYGNNRNNVLIKLNVETGEFVLFRGYDVVGIYVINDVYRSEVCVLVREVGSVYRLGMLDNSGSYYNEPLTKVWQSPTTDCDCPNKLKLIKEISLETNSDIELEIETDKVKKVLCVKGKTKPQTVKINLKCKKFNFKIVSKTSGNYITGVQIVVGVL